MQAQAAGKLAHLYNLASGIYDLVNICSSDGDEEEDGESLQPPMRVMCDMDTDGGGWIVIMRRKRSVVAHVNFIRPWMKYEDGFGRFDTEFWIGLRNIHCLTTRYDVDLMIDLRDNNGSVMTWLYHNFKVNGSDDKYRLQIGEAEGPPGGYNAMVYHSGKQFSTHNSDNDQDTNYDCATGPHTDTVQWNRLLWYLGQGSYLGCYKYYHNVEMKIRPKSCASICEKL